MKNPLLTAVSTVLILLGWFLEVYYYQFRFSGDGSPGWLAIILGAAMTIYLSSLFINTNKRKIVIRTGVIIFSVFCTLSGQNYSYNLQQKVDSEQTAGYINTQNTYNYYTVQIESLQKNIQEKNNLLPDNLTTRTYLNKNGVQPLLLEIKAIKDEVRYYETKRDDLNTGTSEILKSLTAYEMLARDLGLSSSTPLKLISQALLSLFIALMAPSGVRILSSIYGDKKPVVQIKKKVVVSENKEDLYTKYSNSRFGGVESPGSLRGRATVVTDIGISYDRFNKFVKLEKALNLVVCTGNKTMPKVKRSEFEMMIRNRTTYSESKSGVR